MKQFFSQLAILVVIASFTFDTFGQTKTPKKKTTTSKSSSTKAKTQTPSKKTATKPKIAAAKPKPKPKPSLEPTPIPIDPAIEIGQFDAAAATASLSEKASALSKFILDFPLSEKKTAALESLSVTRFALGDEKLAAAEIDEGIKLIRLSIDEAPKPYGEKLFNEVIAKVPGKLYWLGQREAALEIAAGIEKQAAGNANQLIALANFHLGTENGAEAKRLAESAVSIDAANSSAHQTLALAHRLNFDLEESAKSYARAVELDPESQSAKRSLAEMKRSLAKSDEAILLYREILAKNESDNPARNGLILSLFDVGKKDEAETELARSLEQNPANIVLLAGAAYWYAANNDGDKALTLATKAIEREPRYIWSHIALARALMLQKKPVDAEQVLVRARKYGNFPTLEYEIASARLAAGFFREAAEELQTNFVVKDGVVKTKLGGRVERSEKNFLDLLASERRASIFSPAAADTVENSDRLKSLLELDLKLRDTKSGDESETISLVDAFVTGSDDMRFHRGLYAANLLLKKMLAPAKVLELSRSATANVDSLLDVANPGAAVMADELYESRAKAFSRNDFQLVPDVPRSTLSAIVRGRIEEINGLAMLQQGNHADAAVRFKRALTVFPKDSAWWRSATWQLGVALQGDGKEAEALESYISSYKIDRPDATRYRTVETLYVKVNGSTDGLEAKIGANPSPQTPAVPPETLAAKADPPKTETAAVPETSESAKPKADAVQPLPSNVETPKTDEVEAKTDDNVTKTAEEASEIKPEPVAENTSSGAESKPADSKILPEEKTEVPSLERVAANEPHQISPKPLFEPIIITIPGAAPVLPKAVPGEKPAENTQADEVKPDETQAEKETKTQSPEPLKPDEQKQADNVKSIEPEKPAPDESVSNGSARPRIVAGKEITISEIQPCSITVSQESIALINNGGSVGMLLSIDGEADVRSIKGITNSPKDIEIRAEPEIAGVPGRAFFVIKSVSANTGLYQIIFEAPCGRKDVQVRVR